MTPQEIAREAAEEFLADSFPTMSQFLTVEACHKARRDKVAALILSAAAKMVRESGAVEALESFNHVTIEGHGLEQAFEKQEAALTALRDLTDQAGKPQ